MQYKTFHKNVSHQSWFESHLGLCNLIDKKVGPPGLEPGTMQILEPGEDVKFSQPADVGASYAEFLRM